MNKWITIKSECINSSRVFTPPASVPTNFEAIKEKECWKESAFSPRRACSWSQGCAYEVHVLPLVIQGSTTTTTHYTEEFILIQKYNMHYITLPACLNFHTGFCPRNNFSMKILPYSQGYNHLGTDEVCLDHVSTLVEMLHIRHASPSLQFD